MQLYIRLLAPMLVLFVFGLAFYYVPISGLDHLRLMPGDIGDSRLNNYFLENVYLFLNGKSDSLWHLGFFHPYPYVIGFSDNLFGSSPIYILFRQFGFESDTAFQAWFLFGYFANYLAAYYVLRKFGGSTIAATIGALIFAFALPTSAHISHVQLHYRFGVPLALFFLFKYLKTKHSKNLVAAGSWFVWQFYCGIYIGFFLFAASVFAIISYLLIQKISQKQTFIQSILSFYNHFTAETLQVKWLIAIVFTAYLGLICLLFYPYLQVSVQYGAIRSWGEIASMLPRIESYFLSDASHLWGRVSILLGANIPMRHEHQMFIGIFPLILVIIGAILGYKSSHKTVYFMMAGIMIGFVIFTLSIFGGSLWVIFYNIPLASAIRAMTRFDQVLLLPAAYFAMLAIDRIVKEIYTFKGLIIATAIIVLLLVEMSLVGTNTSEKEQWRKRLVTKEQLVPDNIAKEKVLFFAQDPNQPFFAEDIDAMWVALNKNMKTLNGYSGNWPANFKAVFNDNCDEFPNRMLAYMQFNNIAPNASNFDRLRNQFELIGFANCKKVLGIEDASIQSHHETYSIAELKNIFYELISVNEKSYVVLRIRNKGNITFVVNPKNEQRLKLSWRYSNSDADFDDNWDTRVEIPGDIPASGYIDVNVPISKNTNGLLQISMVQEGVFWVHDIGVLPITIPLKQ